MSQIVLLALVFATPLAPLTPEQAALFHGSPQEKLDKRTCGEGERRVMRHCRDSISFVFSNEMAHRAYRPYVEDIGGAYVGVGADHGLTFIAWARSELAWMMDYDPEVVRLNKVNRAFVLASENPAAFRALWRTKQDKAERVLRRTFRVRADTFIGVYQRHREAFAQHLASRRRNGRKDPGHWLDQAETFDYVRAMFEAGRIRIVRGDLLKRRTLTGVGTVARALGVPIRVVYLSNAEEFWTYSPPFRRNLRGLPMDERSVVLRTRHNDAFAPKLDGDYSYAVQHGLDFQRGLAEDQLEHVDRFLARSSQDAAGLMLIGFPREPDEPEQSAEPEKDSRARATPAPVPLAAPDR